jgi:hypothetical protein
MFFINPFIYAGGGDFESIATVTVGSGGAASIEFTSIPGTYQHLQIRGIGRHGTAASTSDVLLELNADSGSNYAQHRLGGEGSSTFANGYASQTSGGSVVGIIPASGALASAFGAFIVDILDYSNTSKNTTARWFHGLELNANNTTGRVGVSSNLWMNTNAVTSMKLTVGFGYSFVQHSTVALYGIKAP